MSDSMATEKTSRFVHTNARIPAVVGMLNVIFGVMLLLYALGWIAWTLAEPYLAKTFMTEKQLQRAEEKARKETQLDDLKKRERAEASAEKKTTLNNEIIALETDLDVNYQDVRSLIEEEKDLRIEIPEWIDATMNLVGSVLMIVSGIGLLSLRQWGRTLALWVAGVQLAWAAFSFMYALTVTIPISVEQVVVEFRREVRRTGPVPFLRTPSIVGEMTAGAGGVMAVATFVFSAIYPSLTLWLLNKRTVKAVFLVVPGREKPQASSLIVSDST
jgi:uncharacterized membrane protein (DUF2068 family)